MAVHDRWTQGSVIQVVPKVHVSASPHEFLQHTRQPLLHTQIKNGPVKVKAAVQIDLDILARQCEQLECQVLVATANGADEGRHLEVEFEHFLCRIPGICHNPSSARMASTANTTFR